MCLIKPEYEAFKGHCNFFQYNSKPSFQQHKWLLLNAQILNKWKRQAALPFIWEIYIYQIHFSVVTTRAKRYLYIKRVSETTTRYGKNMTTYKWNSSHMYANVFVAYTYIKECELTLLRNFNWQDQNQHPQIYIKSQNSPSGTELIFTAYNVANIQDMRQKYTVHSNLYFHECVMTRSLMVWTISKFQYD
jgi:hypothetical protein